MKALWWRYQPLRRILCQTLTTFLVYIKIYHHTVEHFFTFKNMTAFFLIFFFLQIVTWKKNLCFKISIPSRDECDYVCYFNSYLILQCLPNSILYFANNVLLY